MATLSSPGHPIFFRELPVRQEAVKEWMAIRRPENVYVGSVSRTASLFERH
jgi:hypothetical protein